MSQWKPIHSAVCRRGCRLMMVAVLALVSTAGQAKLIASLASNDAPVDAYPWMASLQAGGGHYCGATLIAPRWLLTAATCVMNLDFATESGDITVVLGGQPLDESISVVHEIASIHPHPEWNGSVKQGHDIALLRLSAPVADTPLLRWNDGTLPVHPASDALVLGWGDKGPHPQGRILARSRPQGALQQATLPIVARQACSEAYGESLSEGVICAGYEQGGLDACQGDGGGPLLVREEDGWRQVGIVSWGDGCGQAGKYGVYTEVAAFATWINQTIESEGVEPSSARQQAPSSTSESDSSSLEDLPAR